MKNYVSGVDVAYSRSVNIDGVAVTCEARGYNIDDELRILSRCGIIEIEHFETMKDASIFAAELVKNDPRVFWRNVYYIMPKQETTHEA